MLFDPRNFKKGTLTAHPREIISGNFSCSIPSKIGVLILILIAFITGNSSLEPLIEGLCAQIHVKFEVTCFRPESNRGPYGLLHFLSAALSTTELW